MTHPWVTGTAGACTAVAAPHWWSKLIGADRRPVGRCHRRVDDASGDHHENVSDDIGDLPQLGIDEPSSARRRLRLKQHDGCADHDPCPDDDLNSADHDHDNGATHHDHHGADDHHHTAAQPDQ